MSAPEAPDLGARSIHVEVRDRTLFLTIDRPEKRNAFRQEM